MNSRLYSTPPRHGISKGKGSTYSITERRVSGADPSQGRSQDFEFSGLKPMASAEREPITGVWGQSPQRGPGAKPLVGDQGGFAPLKLKGF